MPRFKGKATMNNALCGLLTILFALISLQLMASDTLRMSLQEMETRFVEENLLLMAERLDLDILGQEIRKAGLWENPDFEIEHQIINRDGKGPIGFTGRDNTAFEIEQLIYTAGKRGHRIQIRELEKLQAEQRLDMLIRQFKRTIREEFITLAFLNRIEGLYQEQIEALEQILAAFEDQAEQGNIPRLEVIRIRSLLLEVEQEYGDVLKDQIDSRQTLRVLLQLEDEVPHPEMPDELGDALELPEELAVGELYETALNRRSDLQSARTATVAAERSLMLEKANQWPDVGVGLVYDRLDGLVNNYFGITFSMELPVWNRNRENMQIAQYQITQRELLVNQKQQELLHEIQASLERFDRATRLLERVDMTFEEEFGTIIDALMVQYQQGDIRLIEFIDFYESFRDGIVRNYGIWEDYFKAAEELNFAVGEDILQFNF